jgi:hypothetical protein
MHERESVKTEPEADFAHAYPAGTNTVVSMVPARDHFCFRPASTACRAAIAATNRTTIPFAVCRVGLRKPDLVSEQLQTGWQCQGYLSAYLRRNRAIPEGMLAMPANSGCGPESKDKHKDRV